MTESTTIDLLRHGRPLSEEGWQEMWRAIWRQAPWEAIVSSPLSRCRDLARALGDKLDMVVDEDERLQDVGFGEWEGSTSAELEQRDPGIPARFYRDPVSNRPAGAEPLDAFRARVSAAVREILLRNAARHVLVVAHAGVIRAVLTQVLDAPLAATYRLSVATASMTRIRADGQRPLSLIFHGRTFS